MYYDDPIVLERFEHPVTMGKHDQPTHRATGDNPFCGDTIELYVSVQEDGDEPVITQATFEGYACSLCVASTDLLLEHITGMPVQEALSITYEDMLALWGGLEVGRTRRGCVELPVKVLARVWEK